MVIAETIEHARSFAEQSRRAGKSVGVVPTMGALHDGHWSLVDRAVAECDVTVVTIFVNPLQFGAGEDLDAYPRTGEADVEGCRRRGVSLVFCPTVGEMYGGPVLTAVQVRHVTERLCGAFRPGHFDGVCTVVCKLFNIIRPHRAYFGEKDYQQMMAVRRMVDDLSMGVDIVGCPIVRESDGLALSSRNRYLSAVQREQAPVIHMSLADAAAAVAQGESDAQRIAGRARARILRGGADAVDYVAVVDVESLEELERVEGPARICVAARFGATRLIDNVAVDGTPPGK